VFEGLKGLGPLAGNEVRATYKISNGAIAYCNSLKHAANAKRYALQIYGSEGFFSRKVFYRWSNTLMIPLGRLATQEHSGKPFPPPALALSGRRYQSHYMVVIEDLLEAMEEDRQPLCGVYEARGATEMIVAVFESHRQGGPVIFPLENHNNPLTMLGQLKFSRWTFSFMHTTARLAYFVLEHKQPTGPP
jgi:predicted dehydrogenase